MEKDLSAVAGDTAHGNCVIGVDGGGTKTVAWLARRTPSGGFAVLGKGEAGPGNPRAAGFEPALENLGRAILAAFSSASLHPGAVRSACLALAGAGRESERTRIHEWACRQRVASSVKVVNDAEPLLAAGTSSGWGVALISGTGSLAYGRNAAGEVARVGGWGYLFGDEGSAYSVAVAGLRAAAHLADGRGRPTVLLERLLARIGGGQAQRLVEVIYQEGFDRSSVAKLATAVLEAADEGDAVSVDLLRQAARELAVMVEVLSVRLRFVADDLPLALAGSWLLGATLLQELFLQELHARGIRPRIQRVSEPVAGAVQLACLG
jgi:N-acetylglucosamine kinase-like BadF-type ATPase